MNFLDDNKAPLCYCGCGNEVTRSKVKPHNWNKYISGHNSRVYNPGKLKPGNNYGAKTRFKKGQKPHNYKDGRATCDGYVYILQPNGKRKAEHRIVAEQKIGRTLKQNEIVHHINGNRKDNRPDNLEVMTRKQHNLHHDPRGWK